jgi:hypothetical protein
VVCSLGDLVVDGTIGSGPEHWGESVALTARGGIATADPSTEARMTVPPLRLLDGRTFAATCGRCLRSSAPVSAADIAQVWGELLKVGWSLYASPAGNRNYAVCPECSGQPWTLEQETEKAKMRRRRQ